MLCNRAILSIPRQPRHMVGGSLLNNNDAVGAVFDLAP
jgi:hypothetical protein